MNDSQASQAISIYDTSKENFVTQTETWWMELPAPPVNGLLLLRFRKVSTNFD
jgi:hypothetical protein